MVKGVGGHFGVERDEGVFDLPAGSVEAERFKIGFEMGDTAFGHQVHDITRGGEGKLALPLEFDRADILVWL